MFQPKVNEYAVIPWCWTFYLEVPVLDCVVLASQLVAPIFRNCAIAIGIHVSSIICARRLAVQSHAQADRLARLNRPEN